MIYTNKVHMIWDDWIEQLSQLSPDSIEWKNVDDFIARLRALFVLKRPKNQRSAEQAETVDRDCAAWPEHLYTMADVDPDDDC